MNTFANRAKSICSLLCLAWTHGLGQYSVQQWHPVDLPFTSSSAHANPFKDVALSATFTGPQGTLLKVPGFYAGNNVWKIRFAPTKIGKWIGVTSSTDPKLNNQTDSVQCVVNAQSKVHGRLF